MSYAQFVTQRRLRRMGAYAGFGGFPSPAFLYTAGDSFAALGMTTTRADASTCARYRDQAGTWQLAAANVPRDQHWQYGASWPTLLREGASTNSALGACSFADDTYWAGSASFTIAPATSCIAGQTAYKHTDAAGGAVRTQDRGIFVNGQTDTEWFCLEDTGDGNAASDITIYDATVGAALYTARVTWATKTIATTAGTGSAKKIQPCAPLSTCWRAISNAPSKSSARIIFLNLALPWVLSRSPIRDGAGCWIIATAWVAEANRG